MTCPQVRILDLEQQLRDAKATIRGLRDRVQVHTIDVTSPLRVPEEPTRPAALSRKDPVTQPIEFSMANGLDVCAHIILECVFYHPVKGARGDLEKALECIELRERLTAGREGVPDNDRAHAMALFCRDNGLPEQESNVLVYLMLWLDGGGDVGAYRLKSRLEWLTDLRYPLPDGRHAN